MPAENEMNAEPIVLTDEASAFLERVEADRAANAGPRFRVNTDRFTAEQGHYYSNLAIVRTPNYDIPSQKGYGPSTAVTIADLSDGRRFTWWVSNTFEQERLQKTIENTISNGGSFPMEVEFVRHKKMSKNGNEYNVLSIAVINSGDDVTLPDVPEDQLEEWTPEDDE
tara:strand:+ start:245 stop:748 length:504 start_codon:yes stop_codon:yes gene_type:complete